MERFKKFATIPAMLGLVLGAGALAGAASLASAQTATTSATQPSISQTAPQFDPHKGGHIGANGVKEVLLTGDQATQATNAALAANPGATIERVETDAEGAVYEAHIVKADGTHATVKFDQNFNITSTETGPGSGGHGGPPPNATNR